MRAQYFLSVGVCSSKALWGLRCLNIGEPPSKPKYNALSDSEQVLRRKGEKETVSGVKRSKLLDEDKQVDTL